MKNFGAAARLFPAWLGAWLGLTFAVPGATAAGAEGQLEAAQPAREVSEATAAELGQLRTLADAKQFPAAVKLIDSLLATAPAESYDTFLLTKVKGEIDLETFSLRDAIALLAKALRLGEKHAYQDRPDRLELIYLLAQTCAGVSQYTPNAAEKRAYLQQSGDWLREWMGESPARTPAAELFAASILYAQAESATPQTPDGFSTALAEAQKGLALSVEPNEQFYVIALASLQQLGRIAEAADVLELLVERHPDQGDYWPQLSTAYLNLVAAAKDRPTRRQWQLRAALAFERAQRRGFLNGTGDQLNLAVLYHNLGADDLALEIFETETAKGTLTDDRRNWDLVANASRAGNAAARGIAILRQAAVLYPTEGNLEYDLAELYYTDHQLEPARVQAEAALAHGGAMPAGAVRFFLARVAFDLRRFDDSSRWLDQTEGQPGAGAGEIDQLRRAIAAARSHPAP